ncbi:MAG TPA: hypothetical protein DCR40_06180 [Prolixibacteraceae bacterium]|nr:hypothetical protein [Prolixibacteraceae bacterium]
MFKNCFDDILQVIAEKQVKEHFVVSSLVLLTFPLTLKLIFIHIGTNVKKCENHLLFLGY